MRECTHYFSVGNGMKGDAIAMDILLRREETFATSRGNICYVAREQLQRREGNNGEAERVAP